MNITARRISGSAFSAEDTLEVTFNSDNQPIASVVHTIEVLSGSDVTHGGGAQQGEYLHYKSIQRDADGNGVIDYSSVIINLVQSNQGDSVVKVKCKVFTKENEDIYNEAIEAWLSRKNLASETESEFTEALPNPTFVYLETGNIVLEYSEDVFV